MGIYHKQIFNILTKILFLLVCLDAVTGDGEGTGETVVVDEGTAECDGETEESNQDRY